MKKMLLVFTAVFVSQFAYANYSVTEIKAILESKRVLDLVKDTPITTISKTERELVYSVVFGKCAVQVTTMPVCPPGLPPEGEDGPGCKINVQFETSDVTCI